MKTKEAIAFFGSGHKLAKAIGIRHPSVYRWGEYPPVGRQYQIQYLSKNKLKAEG